MNTKKIFWTQALNMLWGSIKNNYDLENIFYEIYNKIVTGRMISDDEFFAAYDKAYYLGMDAKKYYYLELIISMPDDLCRYRFFKEMIAYCSNSLYYEKLKQLFSENLEENTLKQRLSQVKAAINTGYINSVANRMMASIEGFYEDTESAIGQAKELIETVCKFILEQEKVEIKSNWNMLDLYNRTAKILDFNNGKSKTNEFAGFSSIIQSITRLRNKYGTGHGKDPDFKPLEKRYAQLAVGAATDIALFFLSTYEDNKNLNNDKLCGNF